MASNTTSLTGSQPNANVNDGGWPKPEDGTVERSVGGSDWSTYTENPGSPYPYSAETSFDLPVNDDLLYFIARGGANMGHLNIVNSSVVKDTADVLVHVDYKTQEDLDHANICLLKKEEENGEGVGIYTPDDWHPIPNDPLRFTATVTLPATSDGKPLNIKRFESTSTDYVNTIGDIKASVSFGALTIQSGAGITSGSVFAGVGTFNDAKASIKGAFDVSESLALTVANAEINAQIGLVAGTQSDSSTTDAASGGDFKVSATASRGPITLVYTSSPVNSIQSLVASTVNAPVKVTLNNAYEGAFTVDSSSAPVHVNKGSTSDPSGQGRTRVVDQKSGGMDHITGSAYWQPNSGPGVTQGTVQITTTRAPITLVV
ncbi:hypothetical protein SERLA73DRAFT_186884 [Serpula lacrymans var. lacrymans S7.3]|uniref:Uncharacterized protein n=2 Tax=Serpula lacrymans var. lacrymans TaxID=341189 RepID=F8Q815_SERL3|nr:uncharacterized protein SERLADRAFT_476157 [Serpula lacrymans var. lacrymans S7.9]EGN95703.1 hypothetical protein SERLA73DRAFT_186884 [Serpula lacrymans var. lacrymans S7.3]EGO21229.1 hypothetical protein SERLADRAFT_476157 [Serpula lacrymans var. lacrymans S7.9]